METIRVEVVQEWNSGYYTSRDEYKIQSYHCGRKISSGEVYFQYERSVLDQASQLHQQGQETKQRYVVCKDSKRIGEKKMDERGRECDQEQIERYFC